MTLTPEVVQRLWRYMQWAYNTTVVNKSSAAEMVLLSKVLPTKGFLDQYVTTIGRRIYVPFEIGVANEDWSLTAQAAVCAHEHQHVVQLDRDGFKYLWSYALSTAARASYETEAYRTTLEMKWYIDGVISDLDHYADGLANYGCKAADVEKARKSLRSYVPEISNGIVRTKAAQIAIGFLGVQS